MSNPFKVGDKVTPAVDDVRYCTTGTIYEVVVADAICVHLMDDDGDLGVYTYHDFRFALSGCTAAALIVDDISYDEQKAAAPVTSKGMFSKGDVLVYSDGTEIPNDEARTVLRCTATCVWFEETYSMPFNPDEFTRAY